MTYATRRNVFLPALLLMCGTLGAQTPEAKFKPGQWEINTTVTLPNGKSIPSHVSICARNLEQMVNRPEPGERCERATITPVQNGLRVQRSCHGGEGNLTFDSVSDILVVIAPDGGSFTSDGTMKTTTTDQKGSASTTTAATRSRGRNTGSCALSEH